VCLLEFDEQTDAREVFDSLRTPGLFAEARMAVADPADRFVAANADRLAGYLAAPASGACLVLAVDSWSPKGELARAASAAKVVSCQPLRGRAVFGWVGSRARERGKRLDRGVAEMLVDAAGNSLSVLDRHIENLAAYVGQRETIGGEDVAQLVGGDPQRQLWELTRAVAAADAREALRVLEQMLRHGQAAAKIIAGLAAEFSRLWRVKRLVRDRASEDELLDAVGRQFRFRLEHMVREADGISPRRLLAAHRTLLDYDLAAKTSAMPEDLLLECLLVRLCAE